MIVTLKTAPILSDAINVAEMEKQILSGVEVLKLTTSIGGSTADAVIRNGAVFDVMSVGLITPYGIVAGTEELKCFINYRNLDESSPQLVYNTIVPFSPSEYSIGRKIEVQSQQDNVELTAEIGLSITTFGLPSVLDATQIPVQFFTKINIDERMIV